MPYIATDPVFTAIAEKKKELDDAVTAQKEAHAAVSRIKNEIRAARKAFADALRRTPGKKSAKKTPKPAGDAPEKPAKKPKPTDAG